MADTSLQSVDIYDDFDEAEAMESAFCNQVSEEQFQEDTRSETDKALGELCLFMDKNPEVYARVLRKRKQEEMEGGGVISYVKSKMMVLFHREQYPQCLISAGECVQKMNSLKAGMCKTFQLSEELKGNGTRQSARLAGKRQSRVANGSTAGASKPSDSSNSCTQHKNKDKTVNAGNKSPIAGTSGLRSQRVVRSCDLSINSDGSSGTGFSALTTESHRAGESKRAKRLSKADLTAAPVLTHGSSGAGSSALTTESQRADESKMLSKADLTAAAVLAENKPNTRHSKPGLSSPTAAAGFADNKHAKGISKTDLSSETEHAENKSTRSPLKTGLTLPADTALAKISSMPSLPSPDADKFLAKNKRITRPSKTRLSSPTVDKVLIKNNSPNRGAAAEENHPYKSPNLVDNTHPSNGTRTASQSPKTAAVSNIPVPPPAPPLPPSLIISNSELKALAISRSKVLVERLRSPGKLKSLPVQSPLGSCPRSAGPVRTVFSLGGASTRSSSVQNLSSLSCSGSTSSVNSSFVTPPVPSRMKSLKRTKSSTSVSSCSSYGSFSSVHSEIVSSNPVARLKATQISRSPGGTPLQTNQAAEPSGPFHKALFTALRSRFKNVTTPSPRSSSRNASVNGSNNSVLNSTFSP